MKKSRTIAELAATVKKLSAGQRTCTAYTAFVNKYGPVEDCMKNDQLIKDDEFDFWVVAFRLMPPENIKKIPHEFDGRQIDLPEKYSGYNTAELLAILDEIRHGGTQAPSEKIEAMNNLVREYRLAPVFQI